MHIFETFIAQHLSDMCVKKKSSEGSNNETTAHVSGTWSETKKMFLGGSILKLADDDV